MSIDFKLYPQEPTTFDKLSPFQLFQLPDRSDIWVKVSNNYARIISQHRSRGRIFEPTEQVILLTPEPEDEG